MLLNDSQLTLCLLWSFRGRASFTARLQSGTSDVRCCIRIFIFLTGSAPPKTN
jgi:hypothetical protein